MIDFSTLPSLENTIARHGVSAKKSLGQHFLLNEAITDDIARFAGDLTKCNVIEIGPGPGGLTRSLLRAGANHLQVVEMDDRFIAIMQELKGLTSANMEVIHRDALQVNLAETTPKPRKIVANLPYNAGTAMLMNWLDLVYEDAGAFESMTLMFQKEVAERIIAEHGSKDYGRLSLICQWLCDCRFDMELPPEAFSPPPKVSSWVITLTPRPKPLVDVSKKALERVVAAAFNQRRKMLRSSLKSLGLPVETLLEEAGVDGSLRAEQLDIMTMYGLAQTYQRLSMKAGKPS